MVDEKQYDLLIKNVKIVQHNKDWVENADIAVKHGKIMSIQTDLNTDLAAAIYDGQGWLAFPGVVDAHMHTGII